MIPKRIAFERLAEIAEHIAGPRLGLWLPYSETKIVRKTGLQFAVVKAYSEVQGGPRSAAELWDDFVRADLQPVLTALTAINILLERYTPSGILEEALVSKFVNPAFYEKSEPEPGLGPDYHLVFNRLGVLAAMKALVAVPKNKKQKDPNKDEQVGRLVLRVNDFISTQAILQNDDSQLDVDLLAEFFPIWELMNPRNLAYGLARSFIMITRHLGGSDSKVAHLRNQLDLDMSSLRYDGVSLEDFIAIVFGLYAHVRNADARKLIDGEAQCVIDTKTFLTSTKFPQEKLQMFLRKRSIGLNKLKRAITGGTGWSRKVAVSKIESDDFATDFLHFRQHPIVDLENGNHLILDIQFVGELLFTGVFFAIFGSLTSSSKRETFLSLWGHIFELYLRNLLRHHYPEPSNILQTDIIFDRGQIDALLDFGTYGVIFEFKFFLLEHKIKHTRKIDRVLKELRLKLVENQKGDAKAVRQLIQATEAVRSRKVKTALQENKPIYPVVIAYEPSVESVAVNTFLNSEFQKLRASVDTDPDPYVRPLTLMSVQDLEVLLPQTGAGHVTWSEVLEKRLDGNRVTITSFHQALYDTMKAKSREFELNSYLMRNFDEIRQDIKLRYGYTA